MELDLTTILLASVTMYLAESYGSIFGGGTFLIQPVLIFLGIPPHLAVAHDIASGIGSDFGSAYMIQKKVDVRWHLAFWWIPGVIIGAFLGSYFLKSVPAEFIEKSVGILAIAMLIKLIFFQKREISDLGISKNWQLLSIIFSVPIGIYGSISGAGTGMVVAMLLTTVFGFSYLESIPLRKIIFIATVIIAIGVFSYQGLLIWELFFPMLFASALAGFTGGWAATKLGEEWLKKLFMLVVALLAIWLLLK